MKKYLVAIGAVLVVLATAIGIDQIGKYQEAQFKEKLELERNAFLVGCSVGSIVAFQKTQLWLAGEILNEGDLNSAYDVCLEVYKNGGGK